MLAVDRVDGVDPLEPDTGFVLDQLRPLKVGLPGRLGHIVLHLGVVFNAVLPGLDTGVLRGDDHIGGPEQGVRAGGIDPELLALGGFKIHLCAGGTANPVFLLGLDPLDKVHIVQAVNELLGVFRDFQHPLGLFLPHHRGAAPFAYPLDHLLVGQDALAAGTPVYGHGGLIGQAVLVELQENPLGPLVVAGVGGVNDPIPVKGVAQHMELAGEVFNVLFGHNGRVNMVFNGKVLRGKAEGIVAHGEQHVIALHALFPGNGVHGRIGPGMSHMKARTGGIGKLHQGIVFGLVGAVLCGKQLFLRPELLPLWLNGGKIVFHDTHLYSSRYVMPGAPGSPSDPPGAHRPTTAPGHKISAAPG